jgi:Family of unknown function (DUF5681)
VENDHRHDGYQTGYGKPPRHTQFRKGKSGNPKGRPRGSKNLTTLLDDALRERVVINESGRRKTATKFQVIVKQVVNRAARGDHRSTQLLMSYFEKHPQNGRDGKPLTLLEILEAAGPVPDEN